MKTFMKQGLIRNILVPCNKSFYDIDGALADLKEIDYRQNIHVEIGAKAYIYVGKPFETGLVYECEVTDTDKTKATIDDEKHEKIPNSLPKHSKRYMTLKLIRKLDHDYLSYSNLRKHGIHSCMQGQCYVPDELQEYIDKK